MLLCGTSDKDRKFHPSGLALTTDEKTEDFRFLFASLKEGVIETQPDIQYDPNILVAVSIAPRSRLSLSY